MRLVTKTLFGVMHQWKEVSQVAMVEWLGEFSQDELAIDRHLGNDDARAIAPVVFTDFG